MRISVNHFAHLDHVIKRMVDDATYKNDVHPIINRITGATGAPVIAVAIMMGVYLGYTENLVKAIESFQKFYKYDGFEGLEPYVNLPDFPQLIKGIWDKQNET